MSKRKSDGPARERFIDETLNLIAEKGSSTEVNLREVSRRVGCAHTNAYNYFANFDELKWSAFRSALKLYSEAIIAGLSDTLSGRAYFRRMIGNMIKFAVDNPGIYRFIGSDPLEPEKIPQEIIATIIDLKRFFMEAVFVLCAGQVNRRTAAKMGNILLAYVDGEIFNLINGRILPDDNLLGRVLNNAEQLFTLLTAKTSDGVVLQRKATRDTKLNYPKLEVSR